jgi:hypothetical protein
MTRTQHVTRGSTTIAIVSLLVAVVSLLVSVLVLFNGSAKQAQFESSRQLCVDGLTRFGRTMETMRLAASAPTTSQIADFEIDGGSARVNCFDTHVLDDKSDFFEKWMADWESVGAMMLFQNHGLAQIDNLDENRSESLGRLVAMADAALVSAATAPGPGLFPWESSKPISPSIPKEETKPTPAATPAPSSSP